MPKHRVPTVELVLMNGSLNFARAIHSKLESVDGRKYVVAVLLIFGGASLALGPDSSWDFYNYHWYNPAAFFLKAPRVDLEAAGLQSAFNPSLDMPLYLAARVLPAPLIGFVSGALGGCVFLLVALIGRMVLQQTQFAAWSRTLATFGCCGAAYLQGFATSTGDVVTAILVLGGLLLVLRSVASPTNERTSFLSNLGLAGALVGAAAGLKLTNAVYAVSVLLALVFARIRWQQRIIGISTIALGISAGYGLLGGWWAFHLWQEYGNPLYPQFGSIFHNSFTTTAFATDTRWLPRSIAEALIWPVIMAVDPSRVGEGSVREAIWPATYLLLVCASIRCLHAKARGSLAGLTSLHRVLLAFFIFAFVIWMSVFGVYRYLVAVEVCAPIVCAILVLRITRLRRSVSLTVMGLACISAVACSDGNRSLGREGWTSKWVSADIPTLEKPEQTVAVIYSRTEAWTWLAAEFPREVAFTQLDSSFPGTEAFLVEQKRFIVSKSDHAYALLDGQVDGRTETAARWNRIADQFGLRSRSWSCDLINKATSHLHLRLGFIKDFESNGKCQFVVRGKDRLDVEAANKAIVQNAEPSFRRLGFMLDTQACTAYRGGVGTGIRSYQWCKLQAGLPADGRKTIAENGMTK